MLAEIGDISRFGSARKLASWAALTPAVRGSDLAVRHGHIPGQGPAWLRRMLSQAAQTARRSPEFAATYLSIAKRRGKKIATIAIARKLLTRACHLLADMQARPLAARREDPAPARKDPEEQSAQPGGPRRVTGPGPYALLTLAALMGAADRVEHRGHAVRLWPCLRAQPVAMNSANRGRRRTGKPVTESNLHTSRARAKSRPDGRPGRQHGCPDARTDSLRLYRTSAEPFISGQDADLELAPVMDAEDLQKGLSRLG
jgi:Transposase IS116/IS110/IS902 family